MDMDNVLASDAATGEGSGGGRNSNKSVLAGTSAVAVSVQSYIVRS